MQQNLPRLILAGTNSGCGKTTVTCAVLQALVNRGLSVAAAMSSSTMSSSLLLGTFAVMMTMERFLRSI